MLEVSVIGKRLSMAFRTRLAENFDVGKVRTVPQAEKVTEKIDLAVGVRPARVLIDLLEQNEVRLVPRDDLRDSQRVVSSVDTPMHLWML
jgi:hypothetical protein